MKRCREWCDFFVSPRGEVEFATEEVRLGVGLPIGDPRVARVTRELIFNLDDGDAFEQTLIVGRQVYVYTTHKIWYVEACPGQMEKLRFVYRDPDEAILRGWIRDR